jgi:aspartate-semialdehyde dehydrogenase
MLEYQAASMAGNFGRAAAEQNYRTYGGGGEAPWGLFGKFAGGVFGSASTLASAKRSQKFIRTVEIPEIKRQSKYEQWRMNAASQKVLGEQRNKFAVAEVELQDTAIDVLAESIKEMTLNKLVAQRDTDQAVALKKEEYKEIRKAAKQNSLGNLFGILG